MNGWPFFFIFVFFFFYSDFFFQVILGWAAKRACARTFISEKSESGEMSIFPSSVRDMLVFTTDNKEKQVRAELMWASRTARYFEGVGCILDTGSKGLPFNPPVIALQTRNDVAWPAGEKADIEANRQRHGVDSERLDAALKQLFEDGKPHTEAVVVLVDGEIVGERYANGIKATTPLLVWSVTKSIINSLVALRVADEKLGLDNDNLFPRYWRDKRSKITLSNLLRMSSGIDFPEEYNPTQIALGRSHTVQMLFTEKNAPGFVLKYPAKYDPGRHWSYSSGTSNLLASLLRSTFDSEKEYLAYAPERLFAKIGMSKTLIETDFEGNLIGSSFGYSTARDLARFGQLFLNDGVWLGERVLPAGWVNYSVTPVPNAERAYGAHWWLNTDQVMFPDVPASTFSANGFDGQFVVVLPEYNAVVVRLGYHSGPDAETKKFMNNLLQGVTSSLKSQTPKTFASDEKIFTKATINEAKASDIPETYKDVELIRRLTELPQDVLRAVVEELNALPDDNTRLKMFNFIVSAKSAEIASKPAEPEKAPEPVKPAEPVKAAESVKAAEPEKAEPTDAISAAADVQS